MVKTNIRHGGCHDLVKDASASSEAEDGSDGGEIPPHTPSPSEAPPTAAYETPSATTEDNDADEQDQASVLSRFWKEEKLDLIYVKKLVAAAGGLEGGIAGCTKDMLMRRMAAVELSKRGQAEVDEILAEDVHLWVAISSYAALTKGKLAVAAFHIGVPAPASHPEQHHHQPASLAKLQRLRKKDLLPLVIEHVLNAALRKQGIPVLDVGGEEWRQRMFDLVFLSSKDSLTRTLESTAQMSHEARFLLQWCKQDSILVTSSSADIFLENRDTWLDGIKGQLKELEGDRFIKDDFKAAKASINEMKHVIECEAGSAIFCPKLYEQLRRHITDATLHVYQDADQDTTDVEIVASATYFESPPELTGLAESLRKPQHEALEKAKMFHADRAEGVNKGDEELQAIMKLRKAYSTGIRESYFQHSDEEMREHEEEVLRCLGHVAHLARNVTEMNSHASMIVLPTGLGKTGVMCALPFMLPLKQSRRVLVVAPNLIIAGTSGRIDTSKTTTSAGQSTESKGAKDFVATGLMQAFGGAAGSFYCRQKLLQSDQPLPRVKSMKDLDGDRPIGTQLQDADIVVANYQQLQGKKLYRNFRRDFFDAVIIDEAHHAEAQGYRMILDHFRGAHKVFLTATPYRGDGKDLRAELIHRTRIREAIEEKYIKNIVLCCVPVKSYKMMDTSSREIVKSPSTWEDIVEDGESYETHRWALDSEEVRDSIMQEAMDCLRWLRSKSGHPHQAIVQAGDQVDAELICQQWRCHPDNQSPVSERLRIDYISSDRKPNENDAVLKRLRMEKRDKDFLDVIVHVGMLGEGFDHTRLSVAVVLSTMRSIGPFSQFIGRAVRKDSTRAHDARTAVKEFEEVAYVIAHPSFGTRELWRAFQESDGEGVTDESPPGPEWTDKAKKDRALAVVNHMIDQEGKTFCPQGRIERALLDYVPSPYISVFYREDCRGASSEQILTPKPNGKDSRSSPTGILSTGVASMLSEGSSSSSMRHHPHSRSSPVAQDDEVVKVLGAEFAAVSRK